VPVPKKEIRLDNAADVAAALSGLRSGVPTLVRDIRLAFSCLARSARKACCGTVAKLFEKQLHHGEFNKIKASVATGEQVRD
jgi:hypothetical protein